MANLEHDIRINSTTVFDIGSVSKQFTAMSVLLLAEQGKLSLDDDIRKYLPEMPQYQSTITIRHLVNHTSGLRDYLTLMALRGERDDDYYVDAEVMDLLARQKQLNLKPGDQWLYSNSGYFLLSQIVKRASGKTLRQFADENIFRPLGMKDTGFSVPAEKLDRLATSYWTQPETGALALYDEAAGGQWSRPPAFPSGAGGLVSTIDDYLAFGRMMLNMGKHGSERLLSRPSVELMTTDQLTLEQKAGAVSFLGENRGWGFGVAMVTRRDDVATVPGRYGWDGGLGTSWCSDPQEDLVGILMSQAVWTSPTPPGVLLDFWTSAYQAIGD
jgi:CubicO group peptidase (beta-lactamase class C family)